jgi:hypothetical protein
VNTFFRHLHRARGIQAIGVAAALDAHSSTLDWIRSSGVRSFVYDFELGIASTRAPRSWIEKLL